MKTKIIGACLLASVVLVGCNTNDNNEEGMRSDKNPVEQTRYNKDMDGLNNEVQHEDGVYEKNRYDQDQVGNKDNMKNNGTNNDNTNNENTNNNDNDKNKNGNRDDYKVSKKASDRINKDVKGINGAYVVMTKNNAYVAANLDKGGSAKSGKELTDNTKKKIKKIVKDSEPNVDKVYVTTDPDFSNLLSNYSDDVNNGKPIRGFFDQFGNMTERLFPENK